MRQPGYQSGPYVDLCNVPRNNGTQLPLSFFFSIYILTEACWQDISALFLSHLPCYEPCCLQAWGDGARRRVVNGIG